MLEVGPPIISSIMGLYPPPFVDQMKARGIQWFATVTTVAEAKAGEGQERGDVAKGATRAPTATATGEAYERCQGEESCREGRHDSVASHQRLLRCRKRA